MNNNIIHHYVVSPDHANPGVWCFAFEQLHSAEEFAKKLTRVSFDEYSEGSYFSGCEGLLLYVMEVNGRGHHTPVCSYVAGEKFPVNENGLAMVNSFGEPDQIKEVIVTLELLGLEDQVKLLKKVRR